MMKAQKIVLLVVVLGLSFSFAARPVQAIQWGSTQHIDVNDSSGAKTYINVAVYGDHREDTTFGKYFSASHHRVIFSIPSTHKVTNVKIRCIAEEYDYTITRSSVSSNEIISYQRNRLHSVALVTILDCDVTVSVYIWDWGSFRWIVTMATYHVHSKVSLNAYYTPFDLPDIEIGGQA
ncbi:MAG: hypothetical protein ACTSYL_00420 [Candidatus Thorarchaeota archaeon]